MKKRIFLFFICMVLFISACSSEGDKENSNFGVKSITPYFSGIDTENNEVKFEFKADLNDKTYSQDFSQNWEIEKISLEDYEFYSQNLNKDFRKLENKLANNDFIYESKNDDFSKISSVFYKPGYYKISYSITDYIDTQKKDLILKIGEVDIPELYFLLNVPTSDKDVSDDYMGHFEISANNIDMTADYIDIRLADLRKSWYNSKIKIDPMKQFVINSGIGVDVKNRKGEILSKEFIGVSDFIQIQGKDSYAFFNNEEINLTNYPIEVLIKKHSSVNSTESFSYSTKNPLYFSILNFLGEAEGKKHFFESSYDTFDLKSFPYKFEKTGKNILSSSLFVGTAGIHFRKSNYTVCFSSDGIISKVVDLDIKRPYPTYPYGYLFGRLGKNGRVFPVGKYFLSELKKIDNFYIYDIAENSLERQE